MQFGTVSIPPSVIFFNLYFLILHHAQIQVYDLLYFPSEKCLWF